MMDIAVYAEKLGFDFETFLGRMAACDEKVFEHADKKRAETQPNNGKPAVSSEGQQ